MTKSDRTEWRRAAGIYGRAAREAAAVGSSALTAVRRAAAERADNRPTPAV